MEVLGIAMMAGMIFGAGVSASKTGGIEDGLKKQIGDIQTKTKVMEDNISTIITAEDTQIQEALDATVDAANAIIKIKDESRKDTATYLQESKISQIYGIIFVTCITLYLLAKLLLPTWKDIKTL
jgi:hypothetical protein|tara:strand:+ start:3435 stop:3809 length:375 start_codon:yes stop_codon:yes gene_type:complete